MIKLSLKSVNLKVVIILVVFFLLVSGFVALGFYMGSKKDFRDDLVKEATKKSSAVKSKSSSSSKSSLPSSIPLTAEQKSVVQNVIESSEMVDAIPKNSPISLRFFYFENGRRIWQDKYILAGGGIVKSGKPLIRLTLHSKYIPEFEKKDFCSVIKEANENRDLGFETDLSKTKLMWKYKGLLKYRDCLGL